MTENKIIGVYFVDATDLEGWTDGTLADALRKPLADVGLDIEIGDSVNNPVFFDIGIAEEDMLVNEVSYIVDKVVTN